MKLIDTEQKPVAIEFTRDEARRLLVSLEHDFSWDETTEEELYDNLWSTLDEGLR